MTTMTTSINAFLTRELCHGHSYEQTEDGKEECSACNPDGETLREHGRDEMNEKELCWSTDQENFNHTSLGDLLDEGEDLAPNSIVYVGELQRPDVSYLCGADDVLMTIDDRAYDIAGEHAEDCAHVSDEAKSELNAFLGDWIRKHCSLNFWQVKDVKPYVLTEADFATVPANQGE